MYYVHSGMAIDDQDVKQDGQSDVEVFRFSGY